MNGKKRIKYPIIVEGKYDKSTLSSIFDATVITTGGFSVFNSGEKQHLIKRLAERGGIILLTDSDGGGRQIRSFLSGIVPKDRLFHLYIPQIEGKERRKSKAGKAGLLGVEGMDREVLERVLAPFTDGGACEENAAQERVTALDFYNDGLSGGTDSSSRRAALAQHLGLPRDMSAKALLEAVNLICGKDGYLAALSELFRLGEGE